MPLGHISFIDMVDGDRDWEKGRIRDEAVRSEVSVGFAPDRDFVGTTWVMVGRADVANMRVLDSPNV